MGNLSNDLGLMKVKDHEFASKGMIQGGNCVIALFSQYLQARMEGQGKRKKLSVIKKVTFIKQN